MMEMDITTPALLFPALSLMMLAYTNRFMGLTQIVRHLTGQFDKRRERYISKQIGSLKGRILIIKYTQSSLILSMLFCVIAMALLLQSYQFAGCLCFAVSLFFMTLSLVLALWEVMVSGNALDIELDSMENT